MFIGDLTEPNRRAKQIAFVNVNTTCSIRLRLLYNVLTPTQLETEEMNRIMALCKRACSPEGGVGDMPGLMEEVSVDYLRTMNKIVLEAQTKEVKNDVLRISLELRRVHGSRKLEVL